ncbi:MAG TPA: DUF6089 family protein [Phnomibacter sp.]|nr:DUF6089 family protein [Phnomibacter sp.]
MYKSLLPLFLLLFMQTVRTQSLDIGIMAGGTNYQGDLQAKYFEFSNMHIAYGGNITYNFDRNWSVRGEVFKGNLSAEDNNSRQASAVSRNLSFKSRVYEVSLVGIYRLSSLENNSITPYIFGGLARYRINPYTRDTGGVKTFLYPLATEGRGLPQYPEKKDFRLYNFSIPFGAGISYAVGPRLHFGIEVGFRKTFTDHLDDVSGVYIDKDVLLQERGSKAVELAYRGDEIAGGDPQYPLAGTPRGTSKANDWYYNAIVRVQYRVFGGSSSSRKQNNRNQMACPKPL